MRKKGISLIVLIITIVIILILTTSVILSLNDKNAIRGARIANLLQTKDAIEASVVIYTSKVRVEWEGKCNTESIIRGLNYENNDLSKYQVVDDEEYILQLRNGEEILLYMINVADFETKANLKVTTPIPKSHWYLDKYGRAYLLFDLDAVIPGWMYDSEPDYSNPSDPSNQNPKFDPNIEGFTYKGGSSGGGSCATKAPTIPNEVLNEVNNIFFSYTEPDTDGNVLITGLDAKYLTSDLPEGIKFPQRSVKGDTVIGIDTNAFANSSKFANVTKILIPEGYRKIGDMAFCGLNSIKAIYIPSTIETITGRPFFNCFSIEKIEIPNKIASGEATVPKDLFLSSATTIKEVNFIGEISKIGDYAFYSFTALKEINIPCTVTSIGSNAYAGCSTADNDLLIPKNVSYIGESAFNGCQNIKSLTFENRCGNLKTINANTFLNCKKIQEVIFPKNVENIGESAFHNCVGIKKVVIPSSIKTLGRYIFYNCASIEEITVPNEITNCSIMSPNTLFGASVGNISKVEYAGEIKKIGDSAFCNFTNLEEINIPDTVEEIGTSAFYGCNLLSKITIPGSVTSIGNSAFSSCKSLETITFIDGNEDLQIGSAAFSGDTKITKAILPRNTKIIGDTAFYGCTSLKEALIPENISQIGRQVFDSTNIEIITIPPQLVDCSLYKPRDVFSWNRSTIKEVRYLGTITKIGDSAFSDFVSLQNINIPNTVTEIDNYAFNQCKAASGVSIPASVEKIGKAAFTDCISITGISWGGGNLTTLGIGVFAGCESLTSVTIPASISEMGYSCFYRCGGLTSATILTTIQLPDTFSACNNLKSISYQNGEGYPWGAPNAPPKQN